jgi:hypothetical protein
VGLFVWGLPSHWSVTAARQALINAVTQVIRQQQQLQQLQQHDGAASSSSNSVSVSVSVASQGSSRRCRGWARVTLPSLAAASAVMRELKGSMVRRGVAECRRI